MVPLKAPATHLVPPLRPSAGSRTVRKIGICGSHSASLEHAPWLDPSWELWGHASSRAWYRRPLDRYFDLHPRSRWHSEMKKGEKYLPWLKSLTIPIYMQERYPEVPASVRYPKERILMEYGGVRRYFKNQVAWMIALAFSEGVTTLGLFGISYAHYSEYAIQRGSAEYWLGRAEERGINLILPDECTLLAEPVGLYGYESHNDKGDLLEAYHPKLIDPKKVITPTLPGENPQKAIPTPDILRQMEEEERTHPRPKGLLFYPPNRSDGGLKESHGNHAG